jgi:hypothetical protein
MEKLLLVGELLGIISKNVFSTNLLFENKN